MAIPGRTIERLIVYRRALGDYQSQRIFSHQLAELCRVSAPQVRRDLMEAGITGHPARGYDVGDLLAGIGRVLDAPAGHGAVVVGVGKIGRALISYFSGRNARIRIVAAFDNDPAKVGHDFAGCRCFHSTELRARVPELGVSLGIIAVPAERAQAVAAALADSGVTGIVNFAPVLLRLGPGVYVEQIDIGRSLEKAAHFSRRNAVGPG
jgi:redox-sensing transcriptional repressor